MEKNLFVAEEDDMSDVPSGIQSGNDYSGDSPASEVTKHDTMDCGLGPKQEPKADTVAPEDEGSRSGGGGGTEGTEGTESGLGTEIEGSGIERSGGVGFGDEDGDPIIKSIPLVHGSVPSRVTQSLHLLQFPGRNKMQNFSNSMLRTVMKPESRVVELKTPMDTNRFYDDNRTEELGMRVENVSLQGVMTESAGGLYAGKAIIDDQGIEKIILTPLDSSAQLRASFKYIDDLDSARVAQMKQDHVQADTSKSTAVHVLQTASKASSQINSEGPAVGGAGSCLRHIKKFNEESWQALSWRSSGDSATSSLVASMQGPSSDLVPATANLSEFIC